MNQHLTPKRGIIALWLLLLLTACHPLSSSLTNVVTVLPMDKRVTPIHPIMPPSIQPHTFKHIFVIQLENEGLAQVQKDTYFADLASRGALMTDYSAVSHPSQPNYIAQIAGDTLVRDDASHDLPQTNLVDFWWTCWRKQLSLGRRIRRTILEIGRASCRERV